MNAFLLSIGDELASGLTVNTNSAWLAQQLGQLGIPAISHVTVGDDLASIATAIRAACEYLAGRMDPSDKKAVLIITGGLGPTEDDLTRQALADALNQQLVEDPDAMLQVARFFKSINRPMAPSNARQALRPHEATILENAVGTAPGLRARHDNVDIFVLPGVPREMKHIFSTAVLPALQGTTTDNPRVTLATKINTFGIGESNLGEKIQDLMARRGPAAIQDDLHVNVGTTVNDGIVSVRLYVTGPRAQAAGETMRLTEEINRRLGTLIFSQSDEPLEHTVAQLLLQQRLTVATAESCTGGMIASMLTSVPGSSSYFHRGWITYANSAKQAELGVPEDMLKDHGAVSEQVALAMAGGAKLNASSHLAIATTGIAGPGGGTAEKPVGTVWIAIASPTGASARKFQFPGTRHQIRLRAAQMSLALLRWQLLSTPSPI